MLDRDRDNQKMFELANSRLLDVTEDPSSVLPSISKGCNPPFKAVDPAEAAKPKVEIKVCDADETEVR